MALDTTSAPELTAEQVQRILRAGLPGNATVRGGDVRSWFRQVAFHSSPSLRVHVVAPVLRAVACRMSSAMAISFVR
jgi:hypothetical protein